MLSQINEYFVCSRAERNGTIALICMIFFLMVLPRYYSYFQNKKEGIDFSKFEQQIHLFSDQPIAENKSSPWRNQKDNSPKNLFGFNPNTATYQNFIDLGLSGKLANTIINFREKGGQFYQKEDLKKIYGFRQEDYQRLVNYIQISIRKPASQFVKQAKVSTFKEFHFDPNTATKEDLLRLGLSEKVIKTIHNYRQKGGRFNTKQDFSKIYGLKQEDYTRLSPYIEILNSAATQTQKEKATKIQPTIETPLIVDINTASADEFKQLKGIGPTYSRRIIKFRNALGGFTTIQQLSETYGLPDSTYQKIQSQLTISPVLQKINVNSANFIQMSQHPYISKSVAKAIVNYRKQHGDFKNMEALETMLKPFRQLNIKRALPYLTIR